MTFVRVVEEVSRADGAVGWRVAIGAECGAFGGYLPAEAAREVESGRPGRFGPSEMPQSSPAAIA